MATPDFKLYGEFLPFFTFSWLTLYVYGSNPFFYG